MEENVGFLNMFSLYEPPEALESVLSRAAVVAADIDAPNRKVSVAIHSEDYIQREILETVTKEVRAAYGLRKLDLTATHPVSQRDKMTAEDLQWLFVQENSMAIGVLAGAQWTWEGDVLRIKLLHNGKEILLDSIPAVQRVLQEKFAAPATIEVESGTALEGQALLEALEKMRDSMMVDLPKMKQAEKKVQ